MKDSRVVLSRFATLLGLGIWLGGIVFAGACAPVLFRVARENGVEAVAPQAFGVMLGRFQFIALACGVLALAGWLGERKNAARPHKLWRAQGALTFSMLMVTGFLAWGVFPRMSVLQREFLPQFRTAVRPPTLSLRPNPWAELARQEFDVLHTRSTRLTMLVFWLGIGALATFAWRTSRADELRTAMQSLIEE
jgi:hypothetical protein